MKMKVVLLFLVEIVEIYPKLTLNADVVRLIVLAKLLQRISI